jgi:LysM repeat protein
MKITNKKRFIRSLIVLIFLVLSLVHTSTAKTESQVINYQIRKGQTLWSIAREYTPSNKDIRQTIYEIEQINDQDLSVIYPGQTIKIKVESENN